MIRPSLAVRSFQPNDVRLSVENGRIPYHVFAARTPTPTPVLPAYLSFKTASPLNETQFLTAIVPGKNEDAARSLINQMTGIAGNNVKGIRVERGNETDLVMFRIGDETQTISNGEWSTDGASLAITVSGNNLELFAVHHARSLRRGNQVLFSSKTPMSAAANFKTDEIDLVFYAGTPSTITLFVGKNPVRVLLGGQEMTANAISFNRNDGTLSLDIPSGQHELKIMFR